MYIKIFKSHDTKKIVLISLQVDDVKSPLQKDQIEDILRASHS